MTEKISIPHLTQLEEGKVNDFISMARFQVTAACNQIPIKKISYTKTHVNLELHQGAAVREAEQALISSMQAKNITISPSYLKAKKSTNKSSKGNSEQEPNLKETTIIIPYKLTFNSPENKKDLNMEDFIDEARKAVFASCNHIPSKNLSYDSNFIYLSVHKGADLNTAKTTLIDFMEFNQIVAYEERIFIGIDNFDRNSLNQELNSLNVYKDSFTKKEFKAKVYISSKGISISGEDKEAVAEKIYQKLAVVQRY